MKEICYREAQIAYLLRSHLVQAGITQRKWAKKHRIPEQIVSDFLNGRRGPSENILEALGFNPEPAWSIAVSRRKKSLPVPARVDPKKMNNRRQLAELRLAKGPPKDPR